MLQQALLRTLELITAGGDAPDTLREVLLVALAAMYFDRASLIAHVETSEHAYVVAATDDPAHRNFALAVADFEGAEDAELHALARSMDRRIPGCNRTATLPTDARGIDDTRRT